ncbi:MAG: thermonuclease family protein [Candidatus Bathyarchaeota archaeon]|nr:thermonuclease family protein [Candidatus Bathyarchaeota archaeon]
MIDGDSFFITDDEVRLADVSAPEWDEPGGSAATRAFKALISGKTVYLDTDQKTGRGQYGRLIAVVYVKTSGSQYINVNKALLNQGVVSLTDYTNNEFNPSNWKITVSTSSNGRGSRLDITLVLGLVILAVIYRVRPKKRMKREIRPQRLRLENVILHGSPLHLLIRRQEKESELAHGGVILLVKREELVSDP